MHEMDLEEEILNVHSKHQMMRIVGWIGDDRKRFRRLMHLFLNGEPLAAQRSAWVVGICAEKHPALVQPYLRRMLSRITQEGIHDAVIRNAVRALQYVEIPPSLLGAFANVCFDFLTAASTPVAVKVFSMTVLAHIAAKEPDLGNEIRMVIEHQLPYGSGGFRARARKVLHSIGPTGAP